MMEDPRTEWRDIVPLVRAAGEAILEVYATPFEVDQKKDRSPVTAADHAANEVLLAGLKERWPEVPVLSEESNIASYGERRDWSRFFLVDPLDGTKEFISRNGEFTVNVALVEQGVAVAGVVGVPVQDVVYHGVVGEGATRDSSEGRRQIGVVEPPEALRVVASRSHRDEATARFLSHLPRHEIIACGSSLKICRVAEGAADVYPRFGPTMEWDTAAAHAVLAAAGGRLLRVPDGSPVRYNKEDLHNPAFVATGPFDPMPVLHRMGSE